MKKGISNWMFREGTVFERMQLAKEAGFEGYELVINEDKGELRLDSSDSDILKIKEFADSIGMELYCLGSGLGFNYPLSSDDEDIRKKAKEIVKRQIDVTKLLGLDTTMLVPAFVGSQYTVDKPITDYDAAYNRVIEGLKELAPYAEDNGIYIGVENVWNRFLTSAYDFANLIDAVGSPYVCAYFDVGNALIYGYPEQWIKILGNRIKKVHIKDFRLAIGNINGFVPLLSGDVNFENVIAALKEIGYDDWLTTEIPTYKRNNDMNLYHSSMSMDKILGKR